jgi:hypothetical protein
MAGVVAACVVGVVALLPSGEPAASVPPASTMPPASPGPLAGSAAPPDPAIVGDDPLAAATALLAARASCIAAKSVLCLDGVDEPGSAALEADSYLVRTAQEGGIGAEPLGLAEASLSVVERLGDSVLLSVEPGSPEDATASTLLLIRVGTGWRIRDLVAEDAG